MKNHEYFAELISRRLDGDLTKEEQDELYAHLAQCEECRRYAEDMLMLSDAFAGSLVEPPDTLRASVMRSVKAERSRKRRIIPGVAGVVAASIAVVLFVRWMPFGGSDANNESMSDQDLMMSVPENMMEDDVSHDVESPLPAPTEDGLSFDVTGDTKPANGGYSFVGAADESDMLAETTGIEGDQNVDVAPTNKMATIADRPASATSVPSGVPESTEPTMKMATYGAVSAELDEYGSAVQSNTNAITAGAGESGSNMATFVLPDAADGQEQDGVQLRSMMLVQPFDGENTANSLNVVSGRLVIDRENVSALTCGTVRNSSDGESAKAVAQIFDYLTALELEEVSEGFDDAQVEGGMDCVVEYEDGHSEDLLYSPDGYLCCNGVWYEFDNQQEPSAAPSSEPEPPQPEVAEASTEPTAEPSENQNG